MYTRIVFGLQQRKKLQFIAQDQISNKNRIKPAYKVSYLYLLETLITCLIIKEALPVPSSSIIEPLMSPPLNKRFFTEPSRSTRFVLRSPPLNFYLCLARAISLSVFAAESHWMLIAKAINKFMIMSWCYLLSTKTIIFPMEKVVKGFFILIAQLFMLHFNIFHSI